MHEDHKCLTRIQRVVEEALNLVARDIARGDATPLETFLRVAAKIVNSYGTPCIEPGPTLKDYVSFLISSFQRIVQTSVDKAMSSLAKHIDELHSPAYALIAALLMDYVSHINTLMSSLTNMVSELDVVHVLGDDEILNTLSLIESLAFGALLRYYAVCEFIERSSGKRLVMLFKNLEVVVRRYMNEERYVLKLIELSLAPRAARDLSVERSREE